MTRAERSQAAHRALTELRQLILEGAFECGARLPETTIAERLGLSRTPLRQAMGRLVEEGLLERVETGGCRVARFTQADIADAIELRGVLEGTAARLAAERGVSCDKAEAIETTLSSLDAVLRRGTFDLAAYVKLNTEFHDQLAGLSGSTIVARQIERVSRLPAASPTAFLEGQVTIPEFRASLDRAQHQHKEIWNAILNREGSRAEALTREHARLARTNLEYAMKNLLRPADRVPGLALVAD